MVGVCRPPTTDADCDNANALFGTPAMQAHLPVNACSTQTRRQSFKRGQRLGVRAGHQFHNTLRGGEGRAFARHPKWEAASLPPSFSRSVEPARGQSAEFVEARQRIGRHADLPVPFMVEGEVAKLRVEFRQRPPDPGFVDGRSGVAQCTNTAEH